MKKIVYTIYQHTVTTSLEGDREEVAGYEVGDELAPELTTLDEARAKIEEYAARDAVEVRRTRYGIGSVTRAVYDVIGWTDDGTGGFMTCDEDGAPTDETLVEIDVLDLHPKIAEAWNRAKLEYFRFLDYERDSFEQVADKLGI